MTPVDDLKIGQWIAVCSERHGSTFYANPLVAGHSFSGRPVQILAISLPFLCVWLPSQSCVDTIDVRRHGVIRLNKRYVKAMTTLPVIDSKECRMPENEESVAYCPACEAPLQNMAATNDDKVHYFCVVCGFSGSVQ